jgi:formylglycine-generating enzyme required for sulfatase activity
VGSDVNAQLVDAAQLPETQRPSALIRIARASVASNEAVAAVTNEIIDLLSSDKGTRRERMELGEALGFLGDPRIGMPTDADYWVHVESETGKITIGRYMVTNHEYKAWVAGGGYTDDAAWSEAGLDWRAETDDPWPVRAEGVGSEPFVVANQPVVGVTFYEAEAYATAVGARLPHADERVWVMRGEERRPYPWGSPFGEGNANTREEVLGRPCAVGLYLRDRTPEGVWDMAGNVAEWTTDRVGPRQLIHPGSWEQPSMAAWAKALSMESPTSRWAALGFRLVRD